MLHSLNSRLLFSYVIVILVCLMVVGLGLFVFVRTSTLWSRGTFLRLEATARVTIPLLHRTSSTGELTDQRTEHLLKQAAVSQDIRILLLDDTGQVRFDTDGEWQDEELPNIVQPRLPKASRTQGAFIAPDGTRWAYVGEVVSAADNGDRQVVAFLVPQIRRLALKWYVENLLPPLVQAGLVALLLSVLIAWIIARSVAKPLRHVAEAAYSLAQGDMDRRAPVSGPREVQRLAQSFNSMADQVQASQQSQRDFVANVSHELKTPLTSIQGFSQALLDGTASGPEGTARAAQVIHSEANRMRRMVDELLILARLDAGQLKMTRDVVAVGPLLRGCLERLAPQAQEANVTLVMKSHESLNVIGDSDRLAQVIINLVDNAVCHTPAGSTVTLGASQSGDNSVAISITDTGEGIPDDELARIFERFYQIDKSRQHSRGAGLGLAIAKEIIEAHGGRITAENVVGLGSKFTVHLPLAPVKNLT